jgi:hypothetical protein
VEGGSDFFNNFDKQLQEAIGLPVVWEDKECFLIKNPAADTVAQIKKFLLTVKKTKQGGVKNIIYDALKPVMEPHGFRLKKSKEGFVKVIHGGKQALGIPFWNYKPRFEFSFVMTIRLDEVQAITNQFSGSPPKYHSLTQTILTQMEHLGLGECRWKAEGENEIKQKSGEAARVVQERILPFFERHQDLVTIAKAANPEVPPKLPLAPKGMPDLQAARSLFNGGNQPYPAMSAITLAHLARLANFDELASRYQKELLSLPSDSRDKFDRLVSFLKERGTQKKIQP